MTAAGDPVDGRAFARLMDRIGGFERQPRLAIGVSGGADSIALALLCQDWVRERGGVVLALTVDHGLRTEAAAEAALVGERLAARGIAHAVLRWEGGKPVTGIQAAAREARARLLAARCREEGILHLALAHHRDDQAETVLLRLARGSGVDGLAGMAPWRAQGDVRVIRPLLEVGHDRLVATCRAAGIDWVEDPSNANPAFARGRLRAVAALLGAEGLDASRLADTARRAARARHALETMTARLLAAAADILPEGWARLDAATLAAADDDPALRALGRVLAAVGGQPYPPKAEALERLLAAVRSGGAIGRTLGGCVVTLRCGRIAVSREPGAAVERVELPPGASARWDGRFVVHLDAAAPGPLTLARLGEEGAGAVRDTGLPAGVRRTLPGVWDAERLIAVPAVGLVRPRPQEPVLARAVFAPTVAPGAPAFPVVSVGADII